ncbi:MAG: hypothetical protein ACRDBQ_18345 [Shewanella sp.]
MALENAYAGNIFRNYNLESLTAALELAEKLNQTIPQTSEVHYVVETADVKPFPLPIAVGDKVYVDARTFASLDRNNELKFRNVVEHSLRLDEARWELVWKRNGSKLGNIMSQMSYHHEVFSKWVEDAMTHTYALTPYQSGQIKAAAALFSVGQFYNNFDDSVKMMRLQQELSRTLGIDMANFESVTGNTEFLFPRNIEEFVEMVRLADITPRLRDFEVLSLQQMLGNSFFGISNEHFLCKSAIEYPPSLFVMIKAILENNMFSRARLTGVVKKCDVWKKKDKFLFAYNVIINQNTLAV